MPLAEAKAIPGVRAVFGEKYPDPVRVVRVGEGDHAVATAVVEFCGGTHLDRTGQVGLFKITSEESVAKGVRRITAVTGHEAVRLVQSMDQVVKAVCGNLRIPLEALPERIEAMQAEIKQLRKQKAGSGGGAGVDGLAASAVTVGPAKVVVGEVDSDDAQTLRGTVDQIRQKLGGPCAVIIGSRAGDRVTLMAGVSEELIKSSPLKAGDWVKAAAAAIGGSGGGKPTMAQAGGKDPEKLPDALAAAMEWIKNTLG
jgi:alanyl-tRNA synthetase